MNKNNILNLTDSEIEEYVVPFNRAYYKERPFCWNAIVYNYYNFMLKLIDSIEDTFCKLNLYQKEKK